jgi:hypothetical protein
MAWTKRTPSTTSWNKRSLTSQYDDEGNQYNSGFMPPWAKFDESRFDAIGFDAAGFADQINETSWTKKDPNSPGWTKRTPLTPNWT